MSTEATVTKEPGEVSAETERTRSGSYYRPNVDIVEGPEELTVFADMPGLLSDQIDINFERGTLQIYGHVPARQREGVKHQRREYGVGDFYRSFQVSEEIDASRISAEYSHGVLTLHLPKSSAAKPRKISVQTR
ncbi:MAG: Hsp20/alpha crystallin family protein [Planctomycetaceae bacterium]|nr:Hsp20/alpha crystallin family protein [Planctomycetaceae bacterium]